MIRLINLRVAVTVKTGLQELLEKKFPPLRGQIQDNRGNEITENSKFIGEHYIECYLIKNGVCVGIGHVDVPIGGS